MNEALLAVSRVGMVIISAFFFSTAVSAWAAPKPTWKQWLIACILTDFTVGLCVLTLRVFTR